MPVRLLLLFTLCAAVSAAAAESQAVAYPSGEETVHGVLYMPDKLKGPAPAIIVIHEWWGLNDWVKDQAAKLAGQGYAALAVDLYRGKSTTDPEVAHELMRGLPEDRARRDLLAAVKFLQSRKNLRPDRIAVIGWCMGGGYAESLAVADPGLAAAVINYGHLSTEKETLAKIHAPVLGLFGALDRGIPPESVRQFESTMQSLGKSVETHIYADAGHGFQNPANKSGYRPDDTEDAWKRITAFLGTHLRKK